MEVSLKDNCSENSGWLTPQQVEQFEDDGLLIIRAILPPEAMQPLIDEMIGCIASGGKMARMINNPSS